MARWPWLFRLLGYRLTLLIDLLIIARCDAIVHLESAPYSKGARVEIAWAEALRLTHWALKYTPDGYSIKILPKE